MRQQRIGSYSSWAAAHIDDVDAEPINVTPRRPRISGTDRVETAAEAAETAAIARAEGRRALAGAKMYALRGIIAFALMLLPIPHAYAIGTIAAAIFFARALWLFERAIANGFIARG